MYGSEITVSVGLLLGSFLGEQYRVGDINSMDKKLPWVNSVSPKNAYEAVDWIVLREKMIDLGYTDNDVQNIYSIRVEEIKEIEIKNKEADEYSKTEVYDKSKPFSNVLSNSLVTKKRTRGPASVQ